MCTRWRAPASASKWRMGFNSTFKGLNSKEKNVVRNREWTVDMLWAEREGTVDGP
jgi:hypothetical protein